MSKNTGTQTPSGLWCKLSVDYQLDPKILQAGVTAELLFIRGMALAKKNDNGFIHEAQLVFLGMGMSDAQEAAQRLVDVGLWDREDGGFSVVAFEAWQGQAKKSAGGLLGNHRRWCVKEGQPIDGCPYCESDTDSVGESDTDADAILEKSREEKNRAEESRTDAQYPLTSNTLSHASVTDFDQFWERYPRKVGKADARKAWKSTTKLRPSLADVLAAVDRAATVWAKGEARFVPHPATWLRQGRWDDEDTTVMGQVSNRERGIQQSVDLVRRLQEQEAEQNRLEAWDYMEELGS